MDFSLTDDQKELERTVRAFCQKRLADPEMDRRDATCTFSRDLWQACADQGLLGLSVPLAYGGSGQDALTATVVMKAIGQSCDDLGLAFSLAAHVFACVQPVAELGNDGQKDAWLPKLIGGDWIATHAITEPEAGSDVFGMKTTATKDGDAYVLSGTKCFATNAPVADVFLVHAKTSERGGFFGLSAFLIERDTPGLTVGSAYEKVGLRTSPTADLYLDECRIPAKNLIGSEGSGAAVFTHSMTWERTCLFALYLGAMERQLEETVAWCRERKQFGQTIGKFQAVAHKVVDMKVRLEAARLLLYKSAWNLANDESGDVDAAIAKLFISESAVASALDALQIHGGAGVMSGRLERTLRDAVPSRIFSGTSEIQKNNIARALRL